MAGVNEQHLAVWQQVDFSVNRSGSMMEPEGIGLARFCHRGDAGAADARLLQGLGHGTKAHIVLRFVGKEGFPFTVGMRDPSLIRYELILLAQGEKSRPCPFAFERNLPHS